MKTLCATVRITVITSALLLTAIVAHIGGGGSFISGDRLVLESSALALLFLLFSSRKLEGPRLATMIVLAQLSIHFILGGMMMNNSRMLLGHIISGIIGYWVINFLEKVFPNLRFKIRILNFIRFAGLTVVSLDVRLFSSREEFNFFSHCERHAFGLRAPPAVEF